MDHPMQHHRTLHGDFFIVGAEKTEEINFMVDMDFTFALCMVDGAACSRSLAARNEFAAAEHGISKTVGYSLDAVFRQMSAEQFLYRKRRQQRCLHTSLQMEVRCC